MSVNRGSLQSYSYGDAGHPFAVTSVSGVGVYGYDQVGAMVSRGGGTLVYDAMHRLVAHAGESYVQSTGNQRLVVTGPAGRVLYLGEVEVTANGPTRTITRHVTIAGTVVAVTTTTGGGTAVVWSCAHPQNSVTCHAPTSGATPGVRRYHPYGTARNSVTTPATTRGYLGQPADTTGLAYLDNRYYDPDLGVFTSVDPLIATTGTPYLYANANPTTLSDPSGLCSADNGAGSRGACIRHRKAVPSGSGGPGSNGSSVSSPVPGYHPDHRPAACTDPLCSGKNPTDDQTSVCSSADRCYRDRSSGGTSQAAFCGWPSRWSMCSDIYGYRDQAYAKVAELARVYGWDRGQTNAFRHSYFMGLIAWNYGSSTATEFGQRHERDTPKETLFVAWDSAADLWNNSIGIAVVERVKGAADISATGASVPAYGMDDVTQQLLEMVTCRCAGNSSSRFNLASATVVGGVIFPGPYFGLDTDVPSG